MRPRYRIHVTVSSAHELEWWQDNLDTFNGMAQTAVQSTCDVHLGAAGLGGLAGLLLWLMPAWSWRDALRVTLLFSL